MLSMGFDIKWIVASLLALFVLLSCALGLLSVVGITLAEKRLRQAMMLLGFAGLGGALVLAAYLLPYTFVRDSWVSEINLEPWFQIADYRYDISLQLTMPATVYAILACCIYLCIVNFSGNYLHRSPAYQRFMFLLALMQTGVLMTCFAKSCDFLFFGWELVSLSSVLLISFFQNYDNAARYSLKALISYRIADAGLILAMFLLHQRQGHAYFLTAPFSLELSTDWVTGVIGFCFIFASLGKSAQFPFTSWLPRAMEGPTPSSALFYGALSVHLGPLLLLKSWEYWAWSPALRLLLGVICLITALKATLIGRTQANVKSQLAYATMTQISFMMLEVAAGLHLLALIHMFSHASLRTWQYLRSSSIIRDFQDNPALYVKLKHKRRSHVERMLPQPWAERLYLHAVQGFHWDVWTHRFFVAPVLRLSCLLCQLGPRPQHLNRKGEEQTTFSGEYYMQEESL